MQNVFQRERNVTHERGLFYGRKQRENETFEKFQAELSALAGRCDFANAAENVRDIFIMNMRESDCQRELSRSTKLPEEVYRKFQTYRLKNGFYGLTSMPAEFQKVIDNLIKEFPQANAFIDDILIASKGTKIEHIALVEKILKKLDVSNVALKLRKCEFAKTECEWLGFRIGESGITPLVRKTQAIEDLKNPKSRKQLKSLMGSLHSLHKFLPKLAELSAPLRPLLSQNNDFVWTPVCENAFQQLKSLVENIVELRHFDIHRETRIICDASHDGLGPS